MADARRDAEGLNPMEYARTSLDIWQRMAEGWDSERKWVWESSRAVSEWMVEAIDPRPGQTILEIACGAGDTGFAAAARIGHTGKLISTDFAPNMVDAARRQSQRLDLTNVEHRVIDAHNMNLADSCVDGVLCRWGFMLMENPVIALKETHRVLRKGGRLAFSVWGEPAANPWAAIPGQVVQEHTGIAAPPPDAPGIFAMADPTRTRLLLTEAGLQHQRTKEIRMTWRFSNHESFWRFLTTMAGAVAMAIAALPPDEQIMMLGKLEGAVESYRTGKGYEFTGMTQNTLEANP